MAKRKKTRKGERRRAAAQAAPRDERPEVVAEAGPADARSAPQAEEPVQATQVPVTTAPAEATPAPQATASAETSAAEANESPAAAVAQEAEPAEAPAAQATESAETPAAQPKEPAETRPATQATAPAAREKQSDEPARPSATKEKAAPASPAPRQGPASGPLPDVEGWIAGGRSGLGIAGTARRPGAPGTHVIPTAPRGEGAPKRVVRHVGVASRDGLRLREERPAGARQEEKAGAEAGAEEKPKTERPVVRVTLSQAAAAGNQTLRPLSPTVRTPATVARQPAARVEAAPARKKELAPPVPLEVPDPDAMLLSVEGPGSPPCVTGIEKAVRAVSGVTEVDANLAAGTVAVVPARVDRAAVEAALAQAGHPARSPEADAATHARTARKLGLAAGLALGLAIASQILLSTLESQAAATLVAAAALGAAWPILGSALRHAIRLQPVPEQLPIVAALVTLAAALLGTGVSPAVAALPLALHLALAALAAGATSLVLRGPESLRAAVPEGPLPAAGSEVEVPPGQPIPADGILLRPTLLDERPLGGDEDVERLVGEPVVAGAIAMEGARIAIPPTPARRVAVGEQIASRALATRPAGTLSQLAATWIVPVALVASLAAFFVGGPLAAAAVLAGASPLGLALAAPLSAVAAISRAAVRGVAVRSSAVLDRAASIRTVLFDRNPTLTRGDAAVLELVAKPGRTAHELLALAAGAEKGLEHALARALVAHAADLRVEVPSARDRKVVAGLGVEAKIGGAEVLVGSARHLADRGVDPGLLAQTAAELAARGRTPLYVAIDGETAGVIGVAETPHESARQAMASLELLGVDFHVASGDASASVQWLAEAIGLDRRLASGELGLEEKRRWIATLREQGPCLLIAGSPVDADLLPAADLTLAAGGGPAVEEKAGAWLIRRDPRGVVELLRAGRAASRGRRLATLAALVASAAAMALGFAGSVGVAGAALLSFGGSLVALVAAAAPWVRVR